MKHEDNTYYHIYNRGANKEKIFFEDENCRYLISLMKKYSKQYNVVITAYCLMPNHYHIICKQLENGSIQRCIQTIFNAYTQALNKQQKRSGTLFEGRAKSREIDSDEYALNLCAYIHLNPVKAHLVETPDEWNFSDYNMWIDKPCEGSETFAGLTLRDEYFDSGEDYKHFVEEYQKTQKENELQKFLFDE